MRCQRRLVFRSGADEWTLSLLLWIFFILYFSHYGRRKSVLFVTASAVAHPMTPRDRTSAEGRESQAEKPRLRPNSLDRPGLSLFFLSKGAGLYTQCVYLYTHRVQTDTHTHAAWLFNAKYWSRETSASRSIGGAHTELFWPRATPTVPPTGFIGRTTVGWIFWRPTPRPRFPFSPPPFKNGRDPLTRQFLSQSFFFPSSSSSSFPFTSSPVSPPARPPAPCAYLSIHRLSLQSAILKCFLSDGCSREWCESWRKREREETARQEKARPANGKELLGLETNRSIFIQSSAFFFVSYRGAVAWHRYLLLGYYTE